MDNGEELTETIDKVYAIFDKTFSDFGFGEDEYKDALPIKDLWIQVITMLFDAFDPKKRGIRLQDAKVIVGVTEALVKSYFSHKFIN